MDAATDKKERTTRLVELKKLASTVAKGLGIKESGPFVYKYDFDWNSDLGGMGMGGSKINKDTFGGNKGYGKMYYLIPVPFGDGTLKHGNGKQMMHEWGIMGNIDPAQPWKVQAFNHVTFKVGQEFAVKKSISGDNPGKIIAAIKKQNEKDYAEYLKRKK